MLICNESIMGFIVIFLVGVLLLSFGIRHLTKQLKFKQVCDQTKGRIVEKNPHIGKRVKWAYILEFKTKDGTDTIAESKIHGTNKFGIYNHNVKVQKDVTVFYSRNNPKICMTKYEYYMALLSGYVFFFGGILYIVLGLLLGKETMLSN